MLCTYNDARFVHTVGRLLLLSRVYGSLLLFFFYFFLLLLSFICLVLISCVQGESVVNDFDALPEEHITSKDISFVYAIHVYKKREIFYSLVVVFFSFFFKFFYLLWHPLSGPNFFYYFHWHEY